jgi:2',3'-cyclic-nucleotide 2'-phosphodiesterase/3'-nucleotidase
MQGSPLGDYVARIKPLQAGEVHPAYKVMNALGYDAANVGNHEFNYGLPFLLRAQRGASIPLRQRQHHPGRQGRTTRPRTASRPT